MIDKVRYLGILFDKNLTWKPHINNVHKQARVSNLLFYNLRKFMPPSVLITLYQALYQSRITYCISIWGACSISALNRITCCQNFVIRMIGGFAKRTAVLYKELKVLPIIYLYKKSVLMFYFRYQQNLMAPIQNHPLTRNNAAQMIPVPFYKKTHTRQSLHYRGIIYFNDFNKVNQSSVSSSVLRKKSVNIYVSNLFLCQNV
jgi:hypothetical protein